MLLGLEVDFFPKTIDAVLDLLSPYPWDFLIGAVHWIGGWSFDHPEVVFEYERRGVDQAYEDYFALETQLAASGAVDVLAHVDLIKVFGHKPERPRLDLYEQVVSAAVASGTAVEINTSGLNPLTEELFPSQGLLEMFQAKGVGITLASDAHRADDVGRHFDVALEAAQVSGYTTRLRFRERAVTEVPLEG